MRNARWIIWICLLLLAAGTARGAEEEADRLDSSARRFRMQTYELFRLNRHELDRRLQWAEQIMSTWRDQGAPDEDVPKLVELFQRTARVVPGAAYVALPSYPARPTPGDTEHPSVVANPSTPSSDHAGAANSGFHDGAPQTTLAPQPSSQAKLRSPSERRNRQPARPSEPIVDSATDPRAKTGEPPRREVGSSDSQRPPASPEFKPPSSPNVGLRTPRLAEVPTEPRSFGSSLVPDVVQKAEPPRRPPLPDKPEIDLDVLEAKVRSVRFSLAAMEAELVEKGEWTIDQLEAVATDLQRLIDSANLVQLYFSAISEPQRALIGPLPDPIPVQTLLAQRVFETRIRLADQYGNDDVISSVDDLHRLKQISEVMQRWNSDYQN